MKTLFVLSWMCYFVPALCAPMPFEDQKRILGIASKYPGDVGIETDPAVIFAENFEALTLEEIAKHWHQISNKDDEVMSLTDDVPPDSSGKQSLNMTANLERNTGGHLYKFFEPGWDELYFRFYVKFSPEHSYVHHFVHMSANIDSKPWPEGHAGELPPGNKRFSTGIEPWGFWSKYSPPGAWNFYTYWQEMKESRDGKYWGNSFAPEQPIKVPRNRWLCVEFMMGCNSEPEKNDGEQAFWIDGELGGCFKGFRWRSTTELKLNTIWLLYYVTHDTMRQNRVVNPPTMNWVWFDDLVVATKYIGPIKPSTKK
jgi:hypothetical protein